MQSETNSASDLLEEETKGFDQIESEDSEKVETEETETEVPGTEEPEKPETNENESKEDAAEDISETETDVADDLSAEAAEGSDVETEMYSVSEEEAEGSFSDVLEDETETETHSEMLLDAGEDINTSYLQSIDLKLTCIISVLLFMVCERKLRHGVRALCGKFNKD